MYTEEFLAEQKQYWLKKYAEAKDFMLSRAVKENAKVLIEIAAQHPLKRWRQAWQRISSQIR